MTQDHALVKFVNYVYDFYNPVTGIYPMNITRTDIEDAIEVLLTVPNITVEYDSIDRERVRDIMESELARTEALVAAHDDRVLINSVGCEFD